MAAEKDSEKSAEENSKTSKFDKDKLAANAIQIKYLIGQLAVMHEIYKKSFSDSYEDALRSFRCINAAELLDKNSDWYPLDGSFLQRYDGTLWTETSSVCIGLLNLGIHTDLIQHKTEEEKDFVRFCSVAPTYPPEDSRYSQTDRVLFVADFKYHEKKYSEAATLYEKAAELGNARAQYLCGMMYLNGEIGPKEYVDVKKDPQKAIDWFQKAAEQEIGGAMFSLGDIYYLGVEDEIQADKAAALPWYQRAAKVGVPLAVTLLKYVYDEASNSLRDASAVFDEMLADYDSYESLPFNVRDWLINCFPSLNYDQQMRFFSIQSEITENLLG
ncbi:MAG: sel1 repeat family protein [Lachnospiraceae bacterium]|nr:sel1 repeat family protein [Lachnospiraceae bacterium]